MSDNPTGVTFSNPPVAAKKGRSITNLAWNLANFLLNIVVGIWLVDYLIKNLGVAAYGLVPLVLQLIPFLQIVTLSVNAALGRYTTIAIEQEDHVRANRIFNTALFAMAGLGVVLLILGLAFVYFSPTILHVPSGMEGATRLLSLLAVIGFIALQLTLPFGVSMFARNRFDIQNMINVLGTILRVATVVVCFTVLIPSVWQVGLSLLVANLVTAVGAVIACKRLTPMLHLRREYYDRSLLKELTTIGGWVVVNQIGMLLFLSIDLIVVNRMFGNEAGGKYAAVLTWSTLLRGLAGTMAGVFGPTVLMYYSRNDVDGMITYVRRAVKFMGLAMGLAIGLICGFAQPILNVWIGREFVPLAALMSLMTIHLCVNLAVLPLFNIQQATNKVQWPGITMILTGILNVVLAVVLAGPVGWGLYGVAAAGAIVLTLKNAVFTPIYNAHILNRPLGTFFPELIMSTFATLFVAVFAFSLTTVLNLSTFLPTLAVGILISVVYFLICYRLLLNDEDRNKLRTMIRKESAA